MMHPKTLPVDLPPGVPARPPVTPDFRPTVLVADDYPENRRLLYFYLRDQYRVLEAPSAETALALLRQEAIDLVLMDLNFQGGLDGVAAVQRLRADPATAHLPVIALTAYSYPEDRRRCLEAGFDDYMAKPVLKPTLLEKARALIRTPAGDGSAAPGGTLWISRHR